MPRAIPVQVVNRLIAVIETDPKASIPSLARQNGMDRSTLYKLLKKYEVTPFRVVMPPPEPTEFSCPNCGTRSTAREGHRFCASTPFSRLEIAYSA